MHKKHFCQLDDLELDKKINPPNGSLFNKFSIWFRKITTVSELHPYTKLVFRSIQAVNEEKRRHTDFSIHPYSPLKYYHQIIYIIIYMLAPMYDLLIASFATQGNKILPGTDTRVLIVNIMCLINVFFNFFNGYVRKTERMNIYYDAGFVRTEEIHIVLNLHETAKNYLCTYFFCDILCVTNIIEYFFFIDTDDYDKFIYTLFPIRLIRFIRLKTVMSYIRTLIYSQYQEDVLQIIQSAMFFILSLFFFGCMLCLIPDITAYHLKNDSLTFHDTMVSLYDRSSDMNYTTAKLIMHALSKALCLLLLRKTQTIEFNIESYIVVTLTTLFGMVVKVSVFLTVFSIIYRRQQSRVKYMNFMNDLEAYVRNKNLSSEIANKTLNYFEVRLKSEYFNEANILNSIQKNMHYEIFSQSSMDLLRKCHLFKKLPNYFTIQLSARLKYEIFLPGVKVIKVGDIATCMYFIANGTVAIYNRVNKELCHLSDGDYFGEIGVIQTTPRVATVITIESCELYRLDIHDFQEVIKPNSEFYKRITKESIRRVVKNVTTASES